MKLGLEGKMYIRIQMAKMRFLIAVKGLYIPGEIDVYKRQVFARGVCVYAVGSMITEE